MCMSVATLPSGNVSVYCEDCGRHFEHNEVDIMHALQFALHFLTHVTPEDACLLECQNEHLDAWGECPDKPLSEDERREFADLFGAENVDKR